MKKGRLAYINTICFFTSGLLGLLLVANQTLFQTVCDYLMVEDDTMWIGFFSTAFYIGMVVVAVISGEIAERIGKKNVITIFSFVVLAGSLVLVFCETPVAALIGFLMLGLGFGAVEGLINGVMVDENENCSSSMLNLTYVMFSIGAILSPLTISNYIALGGDWHYVYYITAALYVALGVLFLFAKTTKLPAAKKEKGVVSLKLFKNKFFVLPCLMIFIYLGAESGATNWTPNIFASTETGAYALAVFWAATGISRFLFSMAAKKNKKSEHKLMTIYSVLGLIGFAGIALFNAQTIVCMIFFALVGFGLGPLWPSYFALGTDNSGKYTAAGSGMVMFFSSLGGAVLSLVIGMFSGFEIMWICTLFLGVALLFQRMFVAFKKKETK